MALSDQEQKLLAQLEAALAADDPRLAQTLRGHRAVRSLSTTTTVVAVTGLIAGAVLLVLGLQMHWVASFLGYLVMFAAGIFGLSAVRVAEPHEERVAEATPVAGAADRRRDDA